MCEHVVENLSPEGVRRLEELLKSRGLGACLDGLYWLDVPVLTLLQKAHATSCGPFAAALEVDGTSVRLELLVRAMNSLHCHCIAEATAEQKEALVAKLNACLAEAGLLP